MSYGFIHGVMNTDNMTISGETIDYGPCAFMNQYDPKTVFSSIDHSGRYSYQNQPSILIWNLAKFAETLIPLVDEDTDISVKKLNNSFSKASTKSLKNILDVTNEKLVSVDFNHNKASAIIDASLTNVIGNKMGKISAWYDNEWGFSNRMCDIAKYLTKIN